LNVSPEEVEANEDTGRSLGERWLTSLERATPELAQASTAPAFDAELMQAVQEAVREYAARGNVVIVGRASGVILAQMAGVLRVFMHAPRAWRIERIARMHGVDLKTAESEVVRMDRARAAYLRDWYGVTFGDPQQSDLSLDTARFGEDASVALVVQAVRAREVTS